MYSTVLDEKYMTRALELAQMLPDEIPIGAVVVKDGVIIGEGANRVVECYSQSRHAEVIAIEEAGKHLRDWRLEGCALYVTVQPCMMCIGLICISRVERLVYGADSPLFGYTLDKEMLPALYKKHIKGVTSGILIQQSQELMEEFFKKKRIAK